MCVMRTISGGLSESESGTKFVWCIMRTISGGLSESESGTKFVCVL